jgi:outer membrane protein TolC
MKRFLSLPAAVPILLLAVPGCNLVVHPVGEQAERARLAAVAAVQGYPEELPVPDVSRRARLSDVLDYAAKRNGSLRAAFFEWQAALERVPQAGALDDPRLMIGYEFAADPFARREMPLDMKKWTTDRAVVGFSQMFPGPGKRPARAERALFEAMGAAEAYRKAYFDVRNAVAAAYAELVYNESLTRIEERNVSVLKDVYEIASHQFHAGDLRQTDIAKLDVEIIRAESLLKAAKIDRERRVAELNALLNRGPRESIGPLDPGSVRLQPSAPAKLLEIAVACNPSLEGLRREVDAKGASLVLADLERLPDFELNLPELRALMQMAMVGFTLPINRERIEAGVREAVARREAVLSRLRSEESNAGARLIAGLSMLRDADRVREDFEGKVETKTRDILALQQSYYGAGSGDVLSILDTQRALLEIEILIARAKADRLRAIAEIEASVGCEVMRAGNAAGAGKKPTAAKAAQPSAAATTSTKTHNVKL